MSIEIFMPALSPTMETGTLSKWLVKEGDTVVSGDVIAEIETDKATMEVESIDDGTVVKILVAEGAEEVPVGQIIAVLAEEGEDIADVVIPTAGATSTAVPVVEKIAESDTPDTMLSTPAAAVVDALPTPVNGQITDAVTEAKDGERVKDSPLARRMAAHKGLDLATVSGTGPYGRIVKRDVEAAKAGAPADAPTVATSLAAAPESGAHDIPFREERLSGMRKVIAKRLTESKQTVPHFYLTIDCEIDTLLAQRKILNTHGEKDGIKISVNDFVIRATALALMKVPAANVQYAGDKMYWYERADVSVAVAIEGGLVTPVVRGANLKGLAEISSNVKELAGKARDGKLMREEYAGGTISISNLGMFGITEFSAVINPPQGAILAIGAGVQKPVVKNGELAVGTVMSVTMSCDHRAIDGTVGAEFLAAFKTYIENPVMMLL